MDFLKELPCWYLGMAIIMASYQGIRGAVEHRLSYEAKVRSPDSKEWIDARFPEWKCWHRWFVLYIHDFIYRFVCAMAGFFSLYLCYSSVITLNLSDLSAGTSALIAFSFIVGVIGVGGQLHYVLLFGKLPK